MLNMSKKITYSGRSVIDGVAAAGFQAIIDSENPSNMSISNWVMDKNLYKKNHETCISDQAEFENYAFTVQDELIAEKTAEK